jgi:hypothetical protein
LVGPDGSGEDVDGEYVKHRPLGLADVDGFFKVRTLAKILDVPFSM